MAIIYPEGWQALKPTGGALREIETLHVLATGLPDSCRIYHGVHWTRVDKGTSFFGEIDFAIVGPAGHLLLIEQKSGFLHEGVDGLEKHYAQIKKSVPVQMARSIAAVRGRLYTYAPQTKIDIDYLLYCPDYTIKTPGSAGIAPERIVDASRREHLSRVILAMVHHSEVEDTNRVNLLHRFLTDALELVPDIGAMIGQTHQLYTHLAGGLAYWARQFRCTPQRLRVIGTAGSGKTQLALALLREAAGANRRALYVCYNRPLADHLALNAPPAATVATFHQLADHIATSQGEPPDFTQADVFNRLEDFMDRFVPGDDWRFDELIIDEGQDFNELWGHALLKLLRPEGRAWWLEDPMQNLYGRPPVTLPGWSTLHADTNYRTPRDVLAPLNRLLGETKDYQSGSPIAHSDMDILSYTDTRDLFNKTKTAMTRALSAHFTRETIAIITYHGREHSRFTPLTQLGTFTLRRFTGTYDLLSNPLFEEGDVLIDSVYRFKGQSAPCVIFTEVDFEELDDHTVRKLFVGMTRASMKLILVVSERAATQLIGRLSD